MSYSEWKDKFVKEKGQQAWDYYEKSAKNKTADAEQYKKYKAVLGKNAPKSIEEFQKLKYTDNEKWEQFKSHTKSIKSGELTPLAGFELYEKTSKEIDTKLVGIVTSNKIILKGKSKHFISRVIGSSEQKRNGVSVDNILEALTNPKAEILPVRTSANGNSQKIRFNGIEVTINPDTGVIIQTNPLKRGEKK